MFRWPWSKPKRTPPPVHVFVDFASPAEREETVPWTPPIDLSEVTANWYPGAVFRRLHTVLTWWESGDLAEAVLAPALPILKPFVQAMASFRLLADSPADRPEIDDDLWDLYALSRVNEFLLMHLQTRPTESSEDVWPLKGAELSRAAYESFMQALGFEPVEARPFHPFFHEITDVSVDPDLGDQVIVMREDWPGYRFGDLMFSRAGVAVRAGPLSGLDGMAARSNLYFAYHRRFRQTRDLSMGWGSNSQWRTRFRRDYLDGSVLRFNVDGAYQLGEPNPSELWDTDRIETLEGDGFNPAERIAFLRHRCLTRTRADSSDFWPYDDAFSEPMPPEQLPPW